MGSKVYIRDQASRDGAILTVAAGDLGNADTSYTYLDLARDGYKYLTVEHLISNTTLTIEMCNVGLENPEGTTLSGTATANNGAGTSITDSSLSTPFPADDDLNGIRIRIVQDDTTPANVGLIRTVTDYVGATGAMTLSSAIGAVTSGVTKFRLEDNPDKFSRQVSDPTTSQWRDVTTILTGVATHTVSGVWFLDTEVLMERLRIKRVTTNASNSLTLRTTRGR